MQMLRCVERWCILCVHACHTGVVQLWFSMSPAHCCFARKSVLQRCSLASISRSWRIYSTPTTYSANAAAGELQTQLLHKICDTHGIQLSPVVQLQHTDWGLSLCQRWQHGALQQEHGGEHVVAVPLHLVLSCSIPGCSPGPDQMSPMLHQLLHSSACSQSWEMQVAVLLLWALRQPPESPIGSFWRQYRQLLPASVHDCTSLLVWSEAELQELQVC